MNAKLHNFVLWVIIIFLLLTLFAVFTNNFAQRSVSDSSTTITSVGRVDELTLRCYGIIRTLGVTAESVTDLVLVINRTNKRIKGFYSNDETTIQNVDNILVDFEGKGEIAGTEIFIHGVLNRITKELQASTIYRNKPTDCFNNCKVTYSISQWNLNCIPI
jgi:uncharacterized protein YuzE